MKTITSRARQVRDESGIGLVEMLWAMFILAIALTAFARMTIVSLHTISANERRTIATALQNETVETLQSIDWYATAMYEDELTLVADDIDTTNNTYQGRPLATLTGPGDDSCVHPDRNEEVPCPVETIQLNGVDYELKIFVTRVDRDGDGDPDTKRITVPATWKDPDGTTRSQTLDAERSWLTATDKEFEVLTFTVSPDPGQLDDNGQLKDGAFKVLVQLNQYTPHDPKVTFQRVVPDEDAPYLVTETVTLSQVNPDRVAFSATISTGSMYFAEGDNPWTVTAEKDGNTASRTTHVQLKGGPYNLEELQSGPSNSAITLTGPSPDPGTSTSVAWTWTGSDLAISYECRLSFEGLEVYGWTACASGDTVTLDKGDGEYRMEVREVYLDGTTSTPTADTHQLAANAPTENVEVTGVNTDRGKICVESNDRLRDPVVVDVNLSGLTSTDSVEVTYVYWTPANKSNEPDGQRTLAADYVSGDSTNATFRATIQKNGNERFKKNRSITISAFAQRSADNDNDSGHTDPAVPISHKCA